MVKEIKFEKQKNDLKFLKSFWKHLPKQKEKPKTIPSIFNKPFDENFISDFLAYILNPKLNGVGVNPIEKIVNRIQDQEKSRMLEEVNEPSKVKIIREYQFNDGTRPDILVIIPDEMIIVIENKVFAKAGEGQLENYIKQTEKEFPEHEHIFLFLTLRWEQSDTAFASLSYAELREALKEVDFPYQKDIRRRVLFDEFILHLEEYFMSSNGKERSAKISKQTELYLEHIDTIEELRGFFEEDSKRIFEAMEALIRESFKEYSNEEKGDDWKFNFKEDRVYQQVYRENWRKNDFKIDVHFEFHFSYEKILLDKKFPFMVDVEGPNRERFFDELRKILPKWEEKLINLNFKTDRKERKPAMAITEIENPFYEGGSGGYDFMKNLKELIFLEEIVEEVFRRLENPS